MSFEHPLIQLLLLCGARAQSCERDACREGSPQVPDSDCCGNPSAVYCADGFTLSFVRIEADWASSACGGSSTPVLGPQPGNIKIGNTCCTPASEPAYWLSPNSMHWSQCTNYCTSRGPNNHRTLKKTISKFCF